MSQFKFKTKLTFLIGYYFFFGRMQFIHYCLVSKKKSKKYYGKKVLFIKKLFNNKNIQNEKLEATQQQQ